MKNLLPLIICFCTFTGAFAVSANNNAGRKPGDINNNGEVTVADVVSLVNHILELPVATFNEANSDINNDGAATVSDITSTVDIILNNTDYAGLGSEERSITKIADRLISDNFKTEEEVVGIGVRLDNSKVYSSLQAEIFIPEGMDFFRVKPGPRAASHQLLYNVTDRGTVKIVLFSFHNYNFADTDEPLFIVEGTVGSNPGDLNIRNIIAANTDCYNYELGFAGGLNEGDPTGTGSIDNREISIIPVADGVEVRNALGLPVSVYTAGGELVKTLVAAADYERVRLKSGIYIVTVGKKSAKVMVP